MLLLMKATTKAAPVATTKWETSGDGKTRRLVREFCIGTRCVGFEGVYSETVPS